MSILLSPNHFGPEWADVLQGKIRALQAKTEHSRTFGPAACRRAINELIVKTFLEKEGSPK